MRNRTGVVHTDMILFSIARALLGSQQSEDKSGKSGWRTVPNFEGLVGGEEDGIVAWEACA